MATILLAAAGASIGAGFGGTVLGLTGAVIGRAVGATVGRAIDQRLLGGGARSVETGRIDRLRLQTAGEGAPIPRIWGQMRVPGHVIWASKLVEVRRSHDAGGKGTGPRVTELSYRLSLAVALCEGAIRGVGRIWADGEEIDPSALNMRVYPGDEAQLPDPAVAAHEGEAAPAWRGTAYVVFEDLALERWGNRVPQLSFEVTRGVEGAQSLAGNVRAVAMIPGTGEYALATRQVSHDLGLGETRVLNRNTAMGGTDFAASLATLGRELPAVESVSLVVSWFGDDLRCGECRIRPKVEQKALDGREMAWRAGGIGRAQAQVVPQVDGRVIYGGTPADESVVEALRAIRAAGKTAVFYPFILMEQLAGNGRPDPWGVPDEDGVIPEQPVMPWRGRITSSVAAGREGSPQGTAAAEAEVAAFFGRAAPGDFAVQGGRVVYSGPDEWSYRRFILHYAHLCRMAGGVGAFLIGSEMVALTQIRGAQGYPAVVALRQLAADVRGILGPDVKLSYAADWSEYFGHHPGGDEARFHLDPLWGDENIDFVGIDNYMPLSDWREGGAHLDAHWGDVRNPDYLRGNVCGGEGYDWYYASEEHREVQTRTPITDGQAEPWIWRYKDLRGWWSNWHYERLPGGGRAAEPTAWVPGSKPIWFTEYGCAALDRATNQPNKFLDAMSSESSLPRYSRGLRDDAMQAAYVEAVTSYWADPGNNPAMEGGGRMVDLSRAHVWAWDARPYPAFPARGDLWSDGPAWERGHWLNGRAGAVALADVVRDICAGSGLGAVDVGGLYGVVRGYAVQGPETGRAALQPLMLAHGFDAVEREGLLRFVMRDGRAAAVLDEGALAVAEGQGGFEITRAPDAEMPGRIRLSHIEAGADYALGTAEAAMPERARISTADSEFPLVLTRPEAQATALRWLAETLVAQDAARFALPPSLGHLGPGDVVAMADGTGAGGRWRIDRIERAGALLAEAVRVEPGVYRPLPFVSGTLQGKPYAAAGPVWPVFLDLPLLTGDEAPHAPWLAVAATPWPGAVRAWVSVDEGAGYQPNVILPGPSVMGVTLEPLAAARPGVLDRGPALRLRLKGGNLRSVTANALLAGGNLLAIGDGSPDRWELMQFAQARLVAPGEWEVWDRLRGQAGTDALMPDEWPAGSVVVLLDGGPRQVDLPASARLQLRHWRVGPASLSPEDAAYRQQAVVAGGAGLRPLSPCHLRLEGRIARWIRRTRVEGDGWEAPEVPLGEASERYLLRLLRGEVELHRAEVTGPEWEIPVSIWAAARAGGGFAVAVAQLSELYGPGPSVRRNVDV
ncbi:MAG TPA: host specificity protein [Paracoccus solventivorans]|uniref:Host specificity protein n=1 Tax=Paracoccus solventivorans TaxID=53463 RepID=A0A832QVP6_9RHOB|nr:glycoside hydrolase TIM-barrel-like domain-containing protein [Paracoccus solventivorans]HHW33467.1 host specificity protein [Paracoccus solventivorans]